jgi:hypothetical protein
MSDSILFYLVAFITGAAAMLCYLEWKGLLGCG